VYTPRGGAGPSAAPGREFHAGLVYSPVRAGEADTLVERACKLPELGAARVVVHDPTGSLGPHQSFELVSQIAEASGLPVGLYIQGAGGNALAASLEAARAGADLIACTVYAVALTLHRVSGESLAQALAGNDQDTGVDVEALWRACGVVDEHLGDEPVLPIAPRIAVRAARHHLPAGLVAALDTHLRAHAAGDRIDDVVEELQRIRAEVGSPPLAAPIGQLLASQALLHVLSASRWTTVVDEVRSLVRGVYGTPPGPLDPGVVRAVDLLSDGLPDPGEPPPLDTLRDDAEGLAASEEELLLLGLFGEASEPLLRSIRGRAAAEATLEGAGVDQNRTERIRELVRIVQESGIGEVTIEEDDLRVTVRRSDEGSVAPAGALGVSLAPAAGEGSEAPVVAPAADVLRVESPMVGTFYRAAEPGAPPYVEIGDVVDAGQTLCILEAMKLFNELKAEAGGVVRAIHADNAQAVEYGQLLFELEPLDGRPLDAL
jgi:oxaloacetate decarboxylase alpha subunit